MIDGAQGASLRRCAIVVGSQGGIGRAIVERLIADGVTVMGWDLEPGATPGSTTIS